MNKDSLFNCIFALFSAIFVTVGLIHDRARATGLAETVLYSFCAQGGQKCTDGAGPAAGLIMDVGANLYGTTSRGGAHGAGTVFELIPNATKTAWTEKVLYSFCARGGQSCTDGADPNAGLTIDAEGNLYGTTPYGDLGGTVFKLTPNAARTSWTETVLYTGLAPNGLTMGAAGNLYVTAGKVLELIPNVSKTAWTATTLSGFLDGVEAGVVVDAAGNLYGTTGGGGAHASSDGSFGGTVFELTPNAAKTKWTERVLYSFCAQRFCADGSSPQAGLTMDAAGRLYGTTWQGGNGGYVGYGTVFELAPNAAKTKWAMTVLHRFCDEPYCPDGFSPEAGLIMDRGGNLYGTTSLGGAAGGGGTAFVLTPNAARTKWAETVLYSFCALGGIDCTDGASSVAGLIMDRSGHLYGTTAIGGAHAIGLSEGNGPSQSNGGTVFELR